MIRDLYGTGTHRLAVHVYRRHGRDDGGTCFRCGQPAPCATWLHARFVILAAGDDPDVYGGGRTASDDAGDRPRGWPAAPVDRAADPIPAHSGFPLRGRRRVLSDEGYAYQREIT
jgi:hypothetical protein